MSFGIYEAIRLTVQGRDCVVEVCELPNECPPLIGQIPLEALDFVVDPIGQADRKSRPQRRTDDRNLLTLLHHRSLHQA